MVSTNSDLDTVRGIYFFAVLETNLKKNVQVELFGIILNVYHLETYTFQKVTTQKTKGNILSETHNFRYMEVSPFILQMLSY